MTPPTSVQFTHPGIAALGAIHFRLTKGDGVAALAMTLDRCDIVVPLQAIAALFQMTETTQDGAMIALITKALQFVRELRLGDTLPTEVLTGRASWAPSAYHSQVALARLQIQLVNWIGGSSTRSEVVTAQMLVASLDDPALRPRVQDALRRAADALGVEGGGPAVASLVERLAGEMAYIEALRDRLLDRVRAATGRLAHLGHGATLPRTRQETMFQVQRLAALALADLAARFAQVDAHTADILSALRTLDRQTDVLRPHRDWLYTTQLAWEPILAAWEKTPAADEGIWRVLEDTYRFLAPRYMVVQQWHSAPAPDREQPAFIW